MEPIDRMELADIGHPRKLASAVLSLIPSVVFPLPIDEVALALGIRAIESIDTDAFAGALLTNESKSNAAILVRSGTLEPRRRFTVGHELGHYLMPLHFPGADGFRCSTQDMNTEERPGLSGRSQWEAQANAFSSELLMPAVELKKRLRSKGGASVDALVALSDEFGTSKIACGRSILAAADEPCAIVVAKDGVVNQIYRSREFPFISLKPGLRLPRSSIAGGTELEYDQISSIEPTEQCEWLSRDNRKGLELFEQVLQQKEGWTLTLLTAEIDEDESEDE